MKIYVTFLELKKNWMFLVSNLKTKQKNLTCMAILVTIENRMVLNCFRITTWTLMFGWSQIRRNTKVQLFVHLFNIVCVEVLKDWISNHFNLHQKHAGSICSIYVLNDSANKWYVLSLSTQARFFSTASTQAIYVLNMIIWGKNFDRVCPFFFKYLPNQSLIWDIFAL